MNEDINLCKILKGHEGETFYNPLVGNIVLTEAKDGLVFFKYGSSLISLPYTGLNLDGNLDLFPSKDQRDWIKWDKENNHKTPKTWSELVNTETQYDYELGKNGEYCVDGEDFTKGEYSHIVTPLEKSACALLKIHQLIEVGYGGNITDKEWSDINILKWYFIPNKKHKIFNIVCSQNYDKKRNIAFHTEKQAEEFLSYTENIQLLKDYYMIE